MKKLIAIVMLIGILASLVIPASAAEGEKVNAMLGASMGFEVPVKTQSKHVPANMWDGIRGYNGDVAGTYCDFKIASSAAEAVADDFTKYNIYFEDGKEGSIYYHVFEIALDKIYDLDSFNIFLQTPTSSANIDGFDVWLSESGNEGTYKKVVSVTELFCGQKFEKYTEDGLDTVMYSAEFEKTRAQFVIFGVTQLRCRHEDALKNVAADMTPNKNPHYFRISEIELWGTPVAGSETTAPTETTPTETTPAATTTDNTTTPEPEATTPEPSKETTTPKADDSTTKADKPAKSGCGSSLAIVGLVPVMLCGAALIVRRRDD